MLNASFGVQRVIRRLRRTTRRRPNLAIQAPSIPVSDRLHSALRSVATSAHLLPGRVTQRRRVSSLISAGRELRPGLAGRLGHERACAISVAVIVVAAAAISNVPAAAGVAGSVGGPVGDAAAPRIVVGGAFGIDRAGIVYGEADDGGTTNAFRPVGLTADPDLADAEGVQVSGPFLEDGTLLKPVMVETSVDDASDMLRSHKIKSGDTLVGIARKYGVSIHTIWWANNMKSKSLKVGRVLTIPPVNGLVVTVRANDTLQSLAKTHKVKPASILKVNKLDDPNLVLGQVLVVPGAKGEPIPTPKPTKKPKASQSKPRQSTKGPSRYTGGRFVWPVSGGYISQYYHYGHYGIDIAADRGTRVKAAAGGRVIFAGWKSNGGGYQVWISHGSGLYTTYNHMSSVSVGTGQSVGRGQQVGRVGSSGYATGPHLHFEVWKGQIWNGGRRVNPMGYL